MPKVPDRNSYRHGEQLHNGESSNNTDLPNFRIERIPEDRLEILRKLVDADSSCNQRLFKNDNIDELRRDNNDERSNSHIESCYTYSDFIGKIAEVEKEFANMQIIGRELLERIELFNENVSQNNFNDYDETKKNHESLIEELRRFELLYDTFCIKINEKEKLKSELLEHLVTDSSQVTDEEFPDVTNSTKSDSVQSAEGEQIKLSLKRFKESVYNFLKVNAAQSNSMIARAFRIQTRYIKWVCEELQREGKIEKGGHGLARRWFVTGGQRDRYEEKIKRDFKAVILDYLREYEGQSTYKLCEIFRVPHRYMKLICEELENEGKIEKRCYISSCKWFTKGGRLKDEIILSSKEFEDSVLDYIRENGGKNMHSLAKEFHVSYRKMKILLEKLMKAGKVERGLRGLSYKFFVVGMSGDSYLCDTERAVLDLLKFSSKSRKEIVRELGVQENIIKYALYSLRCKGEIFYSGSTHHWFVKGKPIPDHIKEDLSEFQLAVLNILREKKSATTREVTRILSSKEGKKYKQENISDILKTLGRKGKIRFVGSTKFGSWVICEE